jgi:plastocyanin domain-containing protein
VTSAGFQPSRIDVGSDRSIVFRRTTDKTCATSVVFPGLGIEKTLPLNTDVAIDLPPGARGELAFQCGMGMDRGKVIVR